MKDNQLKKQTVGEAIVWPLVSAASNRFALRGRRIEVEYEPSAELGHKIHSWVFSKKQDKVIRCWNVRFWVW